jgi:hypothetical protein
MMLAVSLIQLAPLSFDMNGVGAGLMLHEYGITTFTVMSFDVGCMSSSSTSE